MFGGKICLAFYDNSVAPKAKYIICLTARETRRKGNDYTCYTASFS